MTLYTQQIIFISMQLNSWMCMVYKKGSINNCLSFMTMIFTDCLKRHLIFYDCRVCNLINIGAPVQWKNEIQNVCKKIMCVFFSVCIKRGKIGCRSGRMWGIEAHFWNFRCFLTFLGIFDFFNFLKIILGERLCQDMTLRIY
jgi:hypothetical protein